MSTAPAAPAAAPTRLAALDAYRGFVMLLMMAEVLRLKRVAQALPDSAVWSWLAWNQSHVEWVGASLHDLIQPSFSFLVGVALPFSLAARRARGEAPSAMGWHAVHRVLLLVLLGVFLRSVNRGTTSWTFEDTLSQIGLGYGFLYALALRPPRAARSPSRTSRPAKSCCRPSRRCCACSTRQGTATTSCAPA